MRAVRGTGRVWIPLLMGSAGGVGSVDVIRYPGSWVLQLQKVANLETKYK